MLGKEDCVCVHTSEAGGFHVQDDLDRTKTTFSEKGAQKLGKA